MNTAPGPTQVPVYENAEQVAADKRLQCLAEALGRLRDNQDFSVFVQEALREPYFDQRDVNENVFGEALVRGQGEARAYRKILTAIGDAHRVYERLRMMDEERRRGVRGEQSPGMGQGAY